MVRSDKSGAGVMFSIDTETGFPRMVLINAAWGWADRRARSVDPDEYLVFKPLLSSRKLRPIVAKTLGTKTHKLVYAARGTRRMSTKAAEQSSTSSHRMTRSRSSHDGPLRSRVTTSARWTWNGPRTRRSGQLFIVQARPETVQSRRETAPLRTYRLTRKGLQLLSGLSIGDAVLPGRCASSVIRLRSSGFARMPSWSRRQRTDWCRS
jgi:pyruvate,water dikinase